MIGRDFEGKEWNPMRVNAGNVPRTTWTDTFRAWEAIRQQLPKEWQEADQHQWKAKLFDHTKPTFEDLAKQRGWDQQGVHKKRAAEIPTTKDVFKVKKSYKGWLSVH